MFIKSIIAFMLISLSFTASADAGDYGKSCLTHGECQELAQPTRETACFIVRTGTDSNGSTTCALRCYHVWAGNYCQNLSGHQVGICQKETFNMPSFDPANPDCSSAIEI